MFKTTEGKNQNLMLNSKKYCIVLPCVTFWTSGLYSSDLNIQNTKYLKIPSIYFAFLLLMFEFDTSCYDVQNRNQATTSLFLLMFTRY